ncbi:MAG: methyltransferase, partial [Flavobacteriales bacterium]|nr:methyltransferase [Flavobacteriales bacterium]
DAVEIDQDAAEQAAMNAEDSPWRERIRVHRMDVRRMRASEPYDLILCNPPYYGGEMDAPDARVSLAKHGAELGFEEIIDAVDRLLAADGRFATIVPSNREHHLRLAGERRDLRLLRRGPLWYIEGRPFKRVLLELWRGEPRDDHDPITVEHEPGRFTDQYHTLLSAFLLKF